MTTSRTSSKTSTTLVGVFDNRHRAEQAVAELERLGFGPDHIGFAVRDRSYESGAPIATDRTTDLTTDTGPGSGTATGAATGGVLGGIIRAGRAIVTVKPGSRADEARRILQDFGAYDVDTRGASTTAASAPDDLTQVMPVISANRLDTPISPTDRGEIRVPEIEERLDVQ